MSESLTPIDRSSMPEFADYLTVDDTSSKDLTILLTDKGLSLRKSRPEIENIFVPEYINKFKSQMIGSAAIDCAVKTRDYIWRGGDSEVYELAPGVAVKEVIKRADPVASVYRMSLLSDLAEEKLPEWISVPDQYGVVIPESTKDAFVAMQKVNSGINVDWLLEPDSLNDFQRQKIENDIGEVGQTQQVDIRDAYKQLEEELFAAVDGSIHLTEELLPDFDEANVLVERLTKPVEDKSYKLWVIDQ